MKMSQTERLRNILSETEINRFENYQITTEDFNIIKKCIIEILKNSLPEPLKCTSLSAFLGVMISEYSNIPVTVVSGSLKYLNNVIFDGKYKIPWSSKSKITNEVWSGHCWVECPGLIVDISLIRTIHLDGLSDLGKTSVELKKKFPKDRCIADPLSNLNSVGLDYIPRFEVNEELKDGLIKSISKK